MELPFDGQKAWPAPLLVAQVYDNPETDVALNPKIVQAVVRVVTEEPLIHFYLACGHLITVQKDDLKVDLPTKMVCWACEEEKEIRERTQKARRKSYRG